jgi:OFA family oxalate/formate antiporter-like MFS transporter
VVGFGILAGSGIGLGYAAATPPAVKWFPPQRTGLIAGIVVAGFGLASVYISPLANYLITNLGIQQSLLIFGVAFLLVVTSLSLILRNPPEGYKPKTVPVMAMTDGGTASVAAVNYSWIEMLKTPQFYLLWLMYAFGAGAGLMIIAKLAKIVDCQAGVKAGFAFVALLAIGNAGGRIVAGFASDKIGRTRTMLIVFLFQAILIFNLSSINSADAFIVISILLGFNYGANLSLFPSITKDFYGMKNFGVNYGFVFTAWGIGGTVLSLISGRVYDNTLACAKATGGPAVGNFYQAYTIAGVLLLVAAVLTFLVKTPAPKQTTKRVQQM